MKDYDDCVYQKDERNHIYGTRLCFRAGKDYTVTLKHDIFFFIVSLCVGRSVSLESATAWTGYTLYF